VQSIYPVGAPFYRNITTLADATASVDKGVKDGPAGATYGTARSSFLQWH
jgi:hypothetical protein